jgi:exonuclease V gamma subunit
VGAPGLVAIDAGWRMLEVAVAAAGPVGPLGRRTVGVTVDGVRLTGAVAVRGSEILDLSVDDAEKPGRLLRAWIQLLGVLASGHADIGEARVVGVVEDKGEVVPRVVRLGPPPDAFAALEDLIGIWRAARQRPLPLFEHCSYAAAAGQSDAKVDGLWRGTDDLPGEGREPMLGALGAVASPRDLPDFAAYSARLWNPLRASVLT